MGLSGEKRNKNYLNGTSETVSSFPRSFKASFTLLTNIAFRTVTVAGMRFCDDTVPYRI